MTNFADYSGIYSFGAAILFAVLYIPLFLLFVWRSIKRPTYIYIFTCLFCAVRIVAFAMRATIAHSSDAAQDASLNITYAVLYNVGFFSLLYSSYILVLDRAQTVDAPPVIPPRLVSVMQNRNLMRIVLVAAVALGIIGAIKLFNAKNQSDINSANSNRDASVYIFLAITVLLAVQLLLVVRDSFSNRFQYTPQPVVLLLTVLATLLLVREAFLSATTDNHSRQNEEALWYPLVALPEIFAVCIIAIPSLMLLHTPKKEIEPLQLQEQGQGYTYPVPHQIV